MNKIILFLVSWYAILFVFSIIASTTMQLEYIISGLLLSWSSLFFFYLGSKYPLKFILRSDVKTIPDKPPVNSLTFVIISILVLLSSVPVVKFYTGSNFLDVINMTMSGSSLYMKYQKYLSENLFYIVCFYSLSNKVLCLTYVPRGN